jgi:hypothetical protein
VVDDERDACPLANGVSFYQIGLASEVSPCQKMASEAICSAGNFIRDFSEASPAATIDGAKVGKELVGPNHENGCSPKNRR